MCSIEEAWAGQTFSGKPVSSQGDLHKAYMSLPDDVMTHNNEFSMKVNNEPQPASLARGINSKYSRTPRVPNITRNSNDANINYSSNLPPLDNYGGLKPRPPYMEIYDKASPMPNMSGEQFTDIHNAYDVSSTLNNFMQNDLLREDMPEEVNIVNSKYNNKQKQNKNDFSNIKAPNRYDSSDKHNSNDEDYSNTLDAMNTISSNDHQQILFILQQVMTKLDKMERELHHHQSRNMYDIVLYILIGMIISFILYSMFSSMKK
jgi:hypothetical protein